MLKSKDFGNLKQLRSASAKSGSGARVNSKRPLSMAPTRTIAPMRDFGSRHLSVPLDKLDDLLLLAIGQSRTQIWTLAQSSLGFAQVCPNGCQRQQQFARVFQTI